MKKFTIALLLLMTSCPAWAGPLMDAAQEASKEPLKVITTPVPKQSPKSPATPEEYTARQKAMFQEIEMNAMGLTWAEWQASLRQKEKNETTFYNNFGWKSGRSDFDQRAAAGYCAKVTSSFPGSNIDCFFGNGTWVQGAARCTFQAFKLIEYQDASEGNITLNVSYPQQVIKYSDNNQNQITFRISGPNQASIIEARLPDMADASMDVIPRDTQKKAFNVKSNFLIQLLNDVYEAKWKGKVGMTSYCHDILSSPENRQLVIEQATEIYTQPSQPKSKKSK
jgi:hypothetical protein